ILAAGKGTRMKELTNEVPKPMLKVHGKPILEHIISGVMAAGIREFCVITGWRAEVVEEYFGDGARTGEGIRRPGKLPADLWRHSRETGDLRSNARAVPRRRFRGSAHRDA